MIRLINYFLKNSLVVNLITVLIIFVGMISVYILQKEMFPRVDFDTVIVRTIYPGSSAEDVEKLVTIPLELKTLMLFLLRRRQLFTLK